MKKSMMIPGLAALALFSACTPSAPADTGGAMSSSAPAAMEASSSAPAAMEVSSSAPAAMEASSSAPQAMDSSKPRVIEVSMTDWEFSPTKIEVKKGEKVVIRVKGMEGIHSFAIPGMNINVAADPGETKDVEIPTDKEGTFDFRCFIPCGPGHKSMVGQLIIS